MKYFKIEESELREFLREWHLENSDDPNIIDYVDDIVDAELESYEVIE